MRFDILKIMLGFRQICAKVRTILPRLPPSSRGCIDRPLLLSTFRWDALYLFVGELPRFLLLGVYPIVKAILSSMLPINKLYLFCHQGWIAGSTAYWPTKEMGKTFTNSHTTGGLQQWYNQGK